MEGDFEPCVFQLAEEILVLPAVFQREIYLIMADLEQEIADGQGEVIREMVGLQGGATNYGGQLSVAARISRDGDGPFEALEIDGGRKALLTFLRERPETMLPFDDALPVLLIPSLVNVRKLLLILANVHL